jgi:hypothetical protein
VKIQCNISEICGRNIVFIGVLFLSGYIQVFRRKIYREIIEGTHKALVLRCMKKKVSEDIQMPSHG